MAGVNTTYNYILIEGGPEARPVMIIGRDLVRLNGLVKVFGVAWWLFEQPSDHSTAIPWGHGTPYTGCSMARFARGSQILRGGGASWSQYRTADEAEENVIFLRQLIDLAAAGTAEAVTAAALKSCHVGIPGFYSDSGENALRRLLELLETSSPGGGMHLLDGGAVTFGMAMGSIAAGAKRLEDIRVQVRARLEQMAT